MQSNPWAAIDRPDPGSGPQAMRIPSTTRDFFWARDSDGNALLLMRLDHDSMPRGPAPSIRGLRIEIRQSERAGYVVLTLLDLREREVFHSLCLDIVRAAEAAPSEKAAAGIVLARTWRWHHLLRGAGTGELRDEAQKGLIGELAVLSEVVAPVTGAFRAVESWLGPLDAPKDFEVGPVGIEVKTRRGGASSSISITSEDQLYVAALDALFLIVADVAKDATGDSSAETLTEIVERVRAALVARDDASGELFESRVAAAGFSWDHDYSGTRWILQGLSYHKVGDNFPSITPSDLRLGVSRVRYSVSLNAVGDFAIEKQDVVTAISGAGHERRD